MTTSRRDAWVRVGATGLTALYLALAVTVFLGVERRVDTRFTGFFSSAKGFVGMRMLALPETGLQHHEMGFADRLVSVEGEPFRDSAWLSDRLAALPIELDVTYRFERPDGAMYELTAPLRPLPPSLLWGGVLPLLLSGILALLAGLLVVLARPGWEAARVFFMAGWASGLQLTTLPLDTFLDGRLLPATYAVGAVFFGSLLHLALVFPVRRWPLTAAPRLGPTCFYAALSLPWLWSIASHGEPWVPLDTWVRAAYVPLCYALCIPLLLNTLFALSGKGDPEVRRRARIVLPAAALLAGLVVASELWNDDRFSLAIRTGIFVLSFSGVAVAVALATLKGDMLGVGDRTRRTLVQVAVVSLALVAYVVLHAAVQRWAGMGSAWATGVVAGLLAVALVPIIAPLRRLFEVRIEDLFFPDQRPRRETLRCVSLELAQLRDPEETASVLRRAIAERIGALRILVARSGEPLEEISPERSRASLGRRDLDRLYPLFARRQSLVVGRQASHLEPRIIGRLRELGEAFLVPLPAGHAVGGLLIAPDPEGPPRTQGELVFLETLAAQSAIALERAAAWREVRILRERLEQENVHLRQTLSAGARFPRILGSSPALARCLERVQAVAPTSATVLVEGETGTGKELVAHAVHAASDRRDRIFVKVACAAIPESLFESEFFGHEKGAFSGATATKIGRFELADGGTLLLDDVDALALGIQAKLLRALQQGEVQRLGSHHLREVDVRIVATTNKDLAQEVHAGRFREDLFYRLNVIPIHLPPLRERTEDIPTLASHFVALARQKYGRQVEGLSRKDLDDLLRHGWPGNVRELCNLIERSVLLSPGPCLRLSGFEGAEAPAPAASERLPALGGGFSLETELLRYKRTLVEAALARADGNHRRAAELLGLERSSLTRMIHRIGVVRRPPSPAP